tara:strand:- start:355 stop:636 length:282 start_codon:yes stop_codon:yes gene_type:complete
MTNDKQYADNYFATKPKGMLPVMQKIIRDSVVKGSIGTFADMDGYTDKDKNKMSAYRVVASDMGITIGQWILNRETGIARAAITHTHTHTLKG